MALREKKVKAGSWQTLETFWNSKATGFFRRPQGLEIKLYYGYGRFGKDRQNQVLDGESVKKLSVGSWSVMGARMQARTQRDTYLTYDVEPGGVAVMPPGIDLR